MGSEFKWEPSKHTLVCELQIHVSKHLLGCPAPDAGSKVTDRSSANAVTGILPSAP